MEFLKPNGEEPINPKKSKKIQVDDEEHSLILTMEVESRVWNTHKARTITNLEELR